MNSSSSLALDAGAAFAAALGERETLLRFGALVRRGRRLVCPDVPRMRLLSLALRCGLTEEELDELSDLYHAKAGRPNRLCELVGLLARYQRFVLSRQAFAHMQDRCAGRAR